jgi:hypothetical protein
MTNGLVSKLFKRGKRTVIMQFMYQFQLVINDCQSNLIWLSSVKNKEADYADDDDSTQLSLWWC